MRLGLPFNDRKDAGRVLATRLLHYAGRDDVLVLALPRGGVPVAFEVARALHAPLDVFVVRKLGVPGQDELAMGAIASGGTQVLNPDVIEPLSIPDSVIRRVATRELEELRRREHLYRGERPAVPVAGRIVILVDDGLATGSSMRAALAALRPLGPKRLVVAVPVAAYDTGESLRAEADEVICAQTPEPFRAVGIWYRDFAQTSDQEVHELMARAQAVAAAPPSRP